MFKTRLLGSILVALSLLILGSIPLWAQGSLYFFPQVADGSAGPNLFATQFFFNNPSSSSVPVTMTFTLPGGTAWTIDIRSADVSLHKAGGVVTFTLGALKTAHLFTGGINPLASGWVVVQTPAPLEVSEVFDFLKKSPFQLISESGVLPGPLSTEFSFDADVSSDYPISGNVNNTGLAIANPSSVAAVITATLYNLAGTQVSQKTINLAGSGQTSLFLNDLFTDALPPTKSADQDTITGVFHGTVRLSSNVNVAVLVLRDNFVNGGELYSSIAVNSDFSLKYNTFYDVEPNSAFTTAQPITLPARIIGTMVSPTDHADGDYFSVNLTAGQILSVFVVADILGSPLDDTITIYNPAKAQVAYIDDFATGLKDPFITYTVPTTGTYYVHHDSIGGTFSRSSHYELLVMAR